MNLRQAQFSLEPLGDRVFDGFTQGEVWNGWACPYFTFEQAECVVEAHRERGIKAWYDESADLFAFDLNQSGEGDIDAFPAEEVNDRSLYPVGARCWIWEELQGASSHPDFNRRLRTTESAAHEPKRVHYFCSSKHVKVRTVSLCIPHNVANRTDIS